ncbi:hypothetical protein FXO37_11979 [Capsicum annuum]|nr:hypothetical protein FXO37_11979 [Capsicum annuum]
MLRSETPSSHRTPFSTQLVFPYHQVFESNSTCSIPHVIKHCSGLEFLIFFQILPSVYSKLGEAHRRYGGMGTILVSKVSADTASEFGELAADPVTKELLHYTEKAETFVSDRINCGVYVFTPDIFNAIQGVSTQRKDRANLRRVSSFEALQPANRYSL